MSEFVHLHVHSVYSLLDGAAPIKKLVSRAKELGMGALALTDHGAMYGVIDFYKECVKQGVKPIIGIETYVAPNSHLDREGMREYAHLVLLARNEQGYRNLLKLSSIAFVDGFYYRPRIDYDLLEKHCAGLICLSACIAGDIPQYLLNGQEEKARALAKRLKGMFGDDFYIELQNHGLPEQLEVLPKLAALAKELDIKTAATNDIHYVDKDDAEAQDMLLCIQTLRYVDEPDRMRMSADEFYMKSAEQMRRALFDYPEALENTNEIAGKCALELRFDERHLPGFTAPEGYADNFGYLRHLAYEGLNRKMPDHTAAEEERLEAELAVIRDMGFTDYFLIVWDFVYFAHSRGISVGPGRGSGAASLVAYSLDITDVDPIKYDLPFERFLNPERISMPDFDIDFCEERRPEVIDYVVGKYGKDNVAQIITFSTLAAKAVVNDVGRAMRMPGEAKRVAALVPATIGMTLTKALEVSGELQALYNSDPAVKKLVDISLKLEGFPRNAGTHAAGVVICAEPISEYVPLQRNGDTITTQFHKDLIEELGLLKMDFLGLRTLTVIRDALELIEKQGKTLPEGALTTYEDPKIYELISAADTDGVFQLESAGMRQFMLQLRPNNFEDIIAGISLFRPGPMDQIPKYVAGKNDPEHVTYLHEKLRPALRTTYGCMVYQEQVMKIVRDVAGYSMGRSDLVRRAMAKKKHDVMQKERNNFVNGIVENGVVLVPGAVRNGVDAATANRIFDAMTDFASYAFNKPHAAGYAVLAYRTAYLKLYYPVEFMTATLNSYISALNRLVAYIGSATRMGIRVLPPDINKSFEKFSVESGSIRFGLAAIKNVGESAMKQIIASREKDGPFASFDDFLRRAGDINKRMLEAMIKVGCFDSLGAKRKQLLDVCERALAAAANEKKQTALGQLSLFDFGGSGGGMKLVSALAPLPDVPEYPMAYLLELEHETLGIYLSGHPLNEYADALSSIPDRAGVLIENEDGLKQEGDRVRLGGIIVHVSRKMTRSGSGVMAYCTLEDMTGSIECLAFPSVYAKYGSLLSSDMRVIINGRLNVREDQNNMVLIDDVSPLNRRASDDKLYLRMDTEDGALVRRVSDTLRRFPGNVPVVLYDEARNRKRLVPREQYVNPSGAALTELGEFLGADNVRIRKGEQSS
ncbi:MAG: DNA polymerase III subunit alpha [Firmicutes bacterium ADurb.Bin248]|nr:MAG: DNA polymerase III subunit alpha [Firmicutes bacterium ADurb.Bin248]HOG01157.1 DNA polymerase III subunit alpha [Clostridia bacterium]HPK15237.1 DNA polymerase III subunit alpha [Clostridia bacterium]